MKFQDENFIKAAEEYSDGLFRYAFFKLSDRELAKDVAQETLVRSWNHLAKGGEVQNFKAFFYRILNNIIIDEYRKKKAISLDRLREDGFDPKTDIHEKIESKIDGEMAVKMLGAISEKYKEVIFMKYVEGFSNKEIAEMLDVTENSVSVKLHRGLKKIKSIFEQK